MIPGGSKPPAPGAEKAVSHPEASLQPSPGAKKAVSHPEALLRAPVSGTGQGMEVGRVEEANICIFNS